MDNTIETTETTPNKDKWIDQMGQVEALKLLLDDQSKVINILKENINNISEVVNKIFNHLKLSSEGRLIYVGAGTSARIAVQDAVELYPTFGWPIERIGFIIAGGLKALSSTVENAEDDIVDGVSQSKKIDINSQDVVIALTASSKTPFTIEVLKYANHKKALTIGISNNKGDIQKIAKQNITLLTGSEIVAGSTRLKAGTSQKITLNLISTMIMTKFGRVKNGLMVNMVASNSKLKKREVLIKKLLSLDRNV